MQEIQSGTQTTREPVYSMRANAHGINDLGDTYIEVDLTEQYMWYYQKVLPQLSVLALLA